jgi:hypothetical protein
MRTPLLTLALVAPAIAFAQAPTPTTVAALRIRITNSEHAPVAESGVLTFDRQGLIATVGVVGVDAGGRPVPRLGAVRWTTSDENVVSIYDDPHGASVRVVGQQGGRAALTVTALGKTATLPVVVGKARLEIAASELTPRFRAARLEILAERGNSGPDAETVAGGLRIKENGHGARLKARALAADGKTIPLEFFPVAWSTGNAEVVELSQTDTAATQLVGRNTGTTTITATIQGITATVNAEVVPSATTVATIDRAQVVATASGALPVAKGETALPITVKPATGSTSAASEVAPTTTTTTATSPTATATVLSGPVVVTATVEPVVVQATGFRAVAGPAYNQLYWNPAPGAFGYRVTRYDATSQQRVTMKGVAGDTIFPENALTDKAVTAGVTYGYRLLTYFKRSDGSLVATPDTGQGVLSTPKDPNAVPELPASFLGPMDVQAAVERHPANERGLTDVLAIRWNWHDGAAAYEVLRRTSVGTEWYNDAGGLVPGILFLSPRLSNTSVYQYCVRALSPEHPVTKKRIGSAPTYVRVDPPDRTASTPTRKITITKGSATNTLEGAWLDCPGQWRTEARSW